MPMLPNFLIIGAARSGTTSVYHNLSEHPDIIIPVKKEPQFFTSQWERGLDWYQALFADYAGQKAIGEASMSYTYPDYTQTPTRIYELLPDTRLIYILRNPVERTFSHYLYYRHYSKVETLDFEQALQNWDIYLGTSRYYEWIEKYLHYFDRQKLLIIFFEEYVANPQANLWQIFRFLDVDSTFVPTNLTLKTNASFKPWSERLFQLYRRFSLSRPRIWLESLLPQHARPVIRNKIRAVLGQKQSTPQMAAETRSYLQAYFQPQVERLEQFLNRDLSIWHQN